MKRALILSLFLILGNLKGDCATTFFPPLQPVDGLRDYNSSITSLADPFANAPNTIYPDISRVEQSLFGRTFENQNISLRLSRIEKTLFSTTYPSSSNGQRIDNIISNFNQINKYPNISSNELSRMENKIFSQSFISNNPERRIERLEQQIFGAVQSGDLVSRYEAVKMAAKSYNANRNNLYSPNNVTQGGWKGIAANLGNAMLGGSMTGFTPPINPYYAYGGGYNNSYNTYSNPLTNGRSGIYRGYGVNRGLGGYSYGESFSDFGTGTGVTILD